MALADFMQRFDLQKQFPHHFTVIIQQYRDMGKFSFPTSMTGWKY